MKRTVTVIYDEPIRICRKLWVVKELKKLGCEVKIVDIACKVSNIEQRGKAGKISARLLAMWQAVKGLFKSKKGEIVFCWSQWTALFLNILPGASKRYIISYNWLTPQPNGKTRFLFANALNNSHFTAIINAVETKEKLLKAYGVKDSGNIIYIPDVFDDNEVFKDSLYIRENRYCFIGGRANRDWELFLKIAGSCPELKFAAVAVRADWKKEWKIPANVTIKFDMDSAEYYKLMEKAYLTIYPLKENKISGLINIIKSIQLGKLVLTTNLEVTKMYYPDVCGEFLLPIGSLQDWIDEIYKIYSYDKEKYEKQFNKLRQHIIEKFSPAVAGRKLEEIITSLEMADC